jgi:hypothetical protein
MSAAVEHLVEALRAHGCNPANGAAHCPAHTDNTPSLSYAEGRDGRAIMHCHAGCSTQAVVAALGLNDSDLFSDDGQQQQRRRIVATYPYCNQAGELLFEVVRFVPKGFAQRRPEGGGRWAWNLDGVQPVLFRVPQLVEAVRAGHTIFVAEGEKDVQTLVTWGLDSTCNPGGAGKWRPEYSEVLRGGRVVILGDADEPGRKHSQQVAAALCCVAVAVKVVELPGAKDVTEWRDAYGGTREQLERLAAAAPAWQPSPAPGVRASSSGAKRHEARQGMPVTLGEPEPWPQPVDGCELLDEIACLVRRFVSVPEGGAEAVSLWIILAHVSEAVDVLPMLALLSPVKQCGKTTLLTSIAALVPRPLPTSNITPAALFRTVEEFSPTLLIDEADSFLGVSNEMRGILDSGHTRSTAFTVRTVGNDFEPRRFSTWCPKVLALIGRLQDTIEDRSIILHMRRRAPNERIERLRLDRLHHEFEVVRRRAARWAADNLDKLRDADPPIPDGLSDRGGDNWRGLLAIADAVGGRWPMLARKAALALSGGEPESESPGVLLLGDLRELFTADGRPRIPTEDILAYLRPLPERPWGEWRQGTPLTEHGLAHLLRPFEVRPCKKWREGESTVRGYARASFADAFGRYLSRTLLQSATSATTLSHNDFYDTQSATTTKSVAVRNSRNSLLVNDVAVVAVHKKGEGTTAVEEGDV